MDMETGNNPSGTDGITEAEAVSKLSSLLSAAADGATSEVESEDETSQPLEAEDDASEEETPEVSDDAEPTEESDEEAEHEEQPAPDDTLEVDVDGNKLTLAELKASYLRQADYTRKTQEVADAKRAAEVEKVTFIENARAHVMKELELTFAVTQSFAPPQPDPKLIEEDTGEYVRQKAAWDNYQATIQQLNGKYAAHKQAQEQQQAQLMAQAIQEGGAKLLEMHPELNPKSGGEAELASLTKYGLSLFSEQELNTVADPRMFSVLRKAQLWDRMEAQKGKVTQQTATRPPLAKPGTARGVPANTSAQAKQQAMARLNKTGSIDDAVAALKTLAKKRN